MLKSGNLKVNSKNRPKVGDFAEYIYPKGIYGKVTQLIESRDGDKYYVIESIDSDFPSRFVFSYDAIVKISRDDAIMRML